MYVELALGRVRNRASKARRLLTALGTAALSWRGRSIGSAAAFRMVGFLSELHALGIDLFLHQQGLDTTTPAGKAMFQMLGVFAEFERAIIQERVRAGLS